MKRDAVLVSIVAVLGAGCAGSAAGRYANLRDAPDAAPEDTAEPPPDTTADTATTPDSAEAPRDTSAPTDSRAMDTAPGPDTAVDSRVISDTPMDTSRDTAAEAGASCPEPPRCDLEPPTPSARTPWVHALTRVTVALGGPQHRGRDLLLREGDRQFALAKFAYGFNDDDLQDEDVELFLLRGCRAWERLGQVRTTNDGAHAPVEGVTDTGGQVFFELPPERRLGVGLHRIRFVVRGDQTVADQYVRVVPAGAQVAVTDVDGTLTESETAEWRVLFGGASPMVHPGAPEVLWALARRGYVIFYLTARPWWLTQRTHDWVRERALPPGIVHTTLTFTGATGNAARDFKVQELTALTARLGRPPAWAFGNMDSDVQAYSAAGVDPTRAYYFMLSGDLRGGNRHEDYRRLVPLVSAAPLACF
ncbi:MAG: phosphatidylinositol transfer protein [Deltaproteobacteria bacterium]|nr:phosphatidylinositol transfer protein [Deltaproteobacteria bacterium]